MNDRKLREALEDLEVRMGPYDRPWCLDFSGYTKWAKTPYWSVDECTALALDTDPDRVNLDSIKTHPRLSHFVQQYELVRNAILEAKSKKELPERIRPIEFLGWGRQHIDLPAEVEEAVSKNERDIAQLEERCAQLEQRYEALRREKQKLQYEVDQLRTVAGPAPNPAPKDERPTPTALMKKLASLETMVIAIAKAKYRYDPSKRTSAVKNIVDDINREGMKLDEDTIRDHLKDAWKKLPGQET
jgi:hypothetical protein